MFAFNVGMLWGLGIVVALLGMWFIHRIAEKERAAAGGSSEAHASPARSAQLVGQACAVCSARIGTVLDGDFCPDCDAPVHFDCEAEHGCSWESFEEDEPLQTEPDGVETVASEPEEKWVGLRNPGLIWGIWYLFLGVPLLLLGFAGFVVTLMRARAPSILLGGLVALGLVLTIRGINNFRWMRDD